MFSFVNLTKMEIITGYADNYQISVYNEFISLLFRSFAEEYHSGFVPEKS